VFFFFLFPFLFSGCCPLGQPYIYVLSSGHDGDSKEGDSKDSGFRGYEDADVFVLVYHYI